MTAPQLMTSGAAITTATPTITPRIDVLDTPAHIVYIIEIPGADPQKIDLEISSNELVISAPMLPPSYAREATYLYQERVPGNYYRMLVPPANVDAANVSADYRNGILEVKFPKKKARPTAGYQPS